jgi:protein-S-isoprenylcysteine O-methyltransferase Ste14
MTSLPSLGRRGEGWFAIQIVIMAGIFLAGLAQTPLTTHTWMVITIVTVLGAVVAGAGGMLALLGVLHLGRSLTVLPHPRDGSRLVETGAYRLVRHPIYGGLVIAAVGYGLAMQAPGTAVVGPLVLLGFFTLKSMREEVWLEQRYAGYAAYRARTRRILPFIY